MFYGVAPFTPKKVSRIELSVASEHFLESPIKFEIPFDPAKDSVEGLQRISIFRTNSSLGDLIEFKTVSEQFLELLEDIDEAERKEDEAVLQEEAENLALDHGIATSETSFWASKKVQASCF